MTPSDACDYHPGKAGWFRNIQNPRVTLRESAGSSVTRQSAHCCCLLLLQRRHSKIHQRVCLKWSRINAEVIVCS